MGKLKIYKIWQNENNNYDTYDSAVVCAESEDEARHMHPYDGSYISDGADHEDFDGWVLPSLVEVEYLGDAKEGLEKGVIVASYNAG